MFEEAEGDLINTFFGQIGFQRVGVEDFGLVWQRGTGIHVLGFQEQAPRIILLQRQAPGINPGVTFGTALLVAVPLKLLAK